MSEIALRKAHQALIRIKSAIADTSEDCTSDGKDDLITFGPELKEPVTRLLQTLESRLDGLKLIDKPIIESFLGMTEGDLFQFNIRFTGSLTLKSYTVPVAATEKLGNYNHWSSTGLYNHLCGLKKLIPRNETVTSSRTWIESFFFRVSAMVPSGDQLVLSLEERVSSASDNCPGSYVDYTAIRTSASRAEKFLSRSSLSLVQCDHTLFVSEAKKGTLQDHVPRAVCEIYLRAKQQGKNIIRGIVTDGRAWIFLILKMNPNGDGAVYAQTLEPITVMITPASFPGHTELSRTACDVIAGIILNWLNHSNQDIRVGGHDDWFNAEWDLEKDGA